MRGEERVQRPIASRLVKRQGLGAEPASPDIQMDIDDLLAEGNKTMLRWSARGAHTGELMGIPPTEKSITVTSIDIDRFENGQSVEHWEVFDQMGLMQQLGVVPAS